MQDVCYYGRMTNPIPTSVRGWLYVAGIVIGMLIATVVPDIMTALGATQEWVIVATRASGALTSLLSMLSRANLSDPAATSTNTESGEL